jgi:membrane protease YdiL (CAAX protease family)
MFMVLHLNPIRFPHTLALGLTAGIVRVRCKSILPCMVLHFCHNFFCVVMESAGG